MQRRSGPVPPPPTPEEIAVAQRRRMGMPAEDGMSLVHREPEVRGPDYVPAEQMAEAKRLGYLDYLLRRLQAERSGMADRTVDGQLP